MTSSVEDVLAQTLPGDIYDGWAVVHAITAALSSHGYRIVAVPEGSDIEHGDRLEEVARYSTAHDGCFYVTPADKPTELAAGATYVGDWVETGAEPCPSCGGKGELYGSFIKRSGEETNVLSCPDCAGTGRVPDKRGE